MAAPHGNSAVVRLFYYVPLYSARHSSAHIREKRMNVLDDAPIVAMMHACVLYAAAAGLCSQLQSRLARATPTSSAKP